MILYFKNKYLYFFIHFLNKNIYNKMIYYTNKQLFQHGFMFGLGYVSVFRISISMIMLGDWIKAYTDDIKELKEKIDGK